MGNDAKGVSPNHGEIFWNTANDPKAMEALQRNLANDPSMPKWVEGNSVYEIIGTPNAAIQSFVAINTKDNTSYIPGASPYVASNTGFGDVKGSPPDINTAPCANLNLGCISGVGVQQNTPLTPAQKKMGGEYFGKAGTDYQRAAAIAVAAGNPQVAASFEVAAAIAGLLEQSFLPNTGKVFFDSAVDEAVKRVAAKMNIPPPMAVEIAECEIKPRMQVPKDELNKYVGGVR
ncbi:hypothetical protein [Variovorax guangxiensis]|uniref:hypothetical protein n=1 Tax=Variovorax guangxiensis TaxID=1775474 RepID=UPI00112795D8|nr:hypothetical protein [Variovorax guangxiensis]